MHRYVGMCGIGITHHAENTKWEYNARKKTVYMARVKDAMRKFW